MTYLQSARLDLILVAVPIHLLLLRKLLEKVCRNDVLCANQASICTVGVIDDTLADLGIGACTEVVRLHLQIAACLGTQSLQGERHLQEASRVLDDCQYCETRLFAAHVIR